MGETQNLHFYDFGIFESVTKPQKQLFLSLGTPGQLKKIKKHFQIFGFCFLQISKSWVSMFCQFWKRRAPGNDEDPFKIAKILNMRLISIRRHEMEIW